jgi:hypothetical protein
MRSGLVSLSFLFLHFSSHWGARSDLHLPATELFSCFYEYDTTDHSMIMHLFFFCNLFMFAIPSEIIYEAMT